MCLNGHFSCPLCLSKRGLKIHEHHHKRERKDERLCVVTKSSFEKMKTNTHGVNTIERERERERDVSISVCVVAMMMRLN